MAAILATIAALRRAAGVLESLNHEQPLDVYVGDFCVSIQVPRTFGDQGARIREVVRINNGLGHHDRGYEVTNNRHFGIKDSYRLVSAFTPLDAVDEDRSEGLRLLAEAGAA